jgi:hypothetical protein
MHDQAGLLAKDSKIGAIQNHTINSPSVMDFTYTMPLVLFSMKMTEWDKGMVKVYDNFANDFLYPNINNIMVFAENHDTNRINHVYQNDFRKYQMTMV